LLTGQVLTLRHFDNTLPCSGYKLACVLNVLLGLSNVLLCRFKVLLVCF